jgi:sporulation protein YlmC with PRC-barrel domain
MEFDAKEDLTKERNRDDYKLFLTVSDEHLKGAPGFDDKNWPKPNDAKFRTDVDTYYSGKGVRTHMNQMPDKMEGAGDGGVIDRNAEKMAKTAPTDSKGLMWSRRASKVIGADVHNKANEDVGKITDLVADTSTGKISYAVLSYGGVMGIGDKLFAVPMASLATKADDDKFVIDVTKDHLKNAPGFDKNNWPDFASADFRKGVDEFYRNKQTEAKTPMD